MKLSAVDVELFYTAMHALFAYVNRELQLVPQARDPEAMKDLSLDDKVKIRDATWANDSLIEAFLQGSPFEPGAEELGLVESWRQHRVEGRFLLMAHLKGQAVFFDQTTRIPYGVLGLQDEIQLVVAPQVPLMVDAVLLPFRDKIVYDGVIKSYRITFGPGARRNINDVYQKAKAVKGIVSSLPISVESRGAPSDEEMLKFYLKNERNREEYREEISEITHGSPKMLTVYHQIMGKHHARHYGKEFRKIGVNGGWFAILQGLVVASGATEPEAEKVMKKIVPREKHSWVYWFQFKP
jgi:hypothetical protein